MRNRKNNLTDGDIGSQGNSKLQDIEWLSSLSEPELDFLISLKELAIKRATNAGHKDLGEIFNLRMLCALDALMCNFSASVILLEDFKERVKASSEIADSAAILRLVDSSNLSVLNEDDNLGSNSDRNDLSFISPKRNRMWDELCEETPRRSKKVRTGTAESSAKRL